MVRNITLANETFKDFQELKDDCGLSYSGMLDMLMSMAFPERYPHELLETDDKDIQIFRRIRVKLVKKPECVNVRTHLDELEDAVKAEANK